jgi:hypothetical protein
MLVAMSDFVISCHTTGGPYCNDDEGYSGCLLKGHETKNGSPVWTTHFGELGWIDGTDIKGKSAYLPRRAYFFPVIDVGTVQPYGPGEHCVPDFQ